MEKLLYILIALVIIDLCAGIFLGIKFRRVFEFEERLRKLEEKIDNKD